MSESENLFLIENNKTEIEINEKDARTLGKLGEELASGRDRFGNLEEDSESTLIKVSPPLGSGKPYKISVMNSIGSIKIGEKTYDVRPKIDKDHFNFLFFNNEDPNKKIRLSEQLIEGGKVEGSLFWQMVESFLKNTEIVINKGIQKGYKLVEDELPYVSGRLDVLTTTKNLLVGKLKIKSEFEEFTPDISINRLIKEAVKKIITNELKTKYNPQVESFINEKRKQARYILSNFHEVGDYLVQDKYLSNVDRNNAYYKEAYSLGLKILEYEYLSSAEGDSEVSVSLFRTPDVVENGLRLALNQKMTSSFRCQRGGDTLPAGAGITGKPDLAFYFEKDKIATGDIKYKLFSENNNNQLEPNRHDINQIYSFMDGAGVNKGILIGFDNTGKELKDNGENYYEGSDKIIKSIPWRLKNITPEESLKNVIKEITNFLEED